mmetsp:Transcript_21516/g.59602  ORF Transcript_21516/g.59602 Transcript_21516/m.59602 type:complete len:248 (-) Transcript_21516:81-824(-)
MLKGCAWGPGGGAAAAPPPPPPPPAAACCPCSAAARLGMPAPPPAPPAAAGGARTSGKGTPEVKYSTARSGLLKAARIARTTCSLSKPISQMLLMAPSKAPPDSRPESAAAAGVAAGLAVAAAGWAGVGVAAAGAAGGGAWGAGAAGVGAGAAAAGAAWAAGLGLGAKTTMKPSSESPASVRFSASLSSTLPLYTSFMVSFDSPRSSHTLSFTDPTLLAASNSLLNVSPLTVLNVNFILACNDINRL